MLYLRKFSLEEQKQILKDAKEKNRRDRVAREDYVFEQGEATGYIYNHKAPHSALVAEVTNGVY